MAELFTQLFDHWLQTKVGFFDMVCGVFVAFGLWCLDYVVSEVRLGRTVTAVVLAISGVVFVIAGLLVATSTVTALVASSLMGGIYYMLFRLAKARQQARSRSPEASS